MNIAEETSREWYSKADVGVVVHAALFQRGPSFYLKAAIALALQNMDVCCTSSVGLQTADPCKYIFEGFTKHGGKHAP